MKQSKIKNMLEISLFSALIAISSMLSIPFPIPMTLQTFAIFLALMTLGGKNGLIAICVYISLGLVGLPIFAGFGSGIGYLLGASGGFIIGFPLAAALYLISERAFGVSRRKKLVYSLLSLAIIYAVGSLWFSFVYSNGTGFLAAITVTVLPYVIPDIIKILLALFISERLKRIPKA